MSITKNKQVLNNKLKTLGKFTIRVSEALLQVQVSVQWDPDAISTDNPGGHSGSHRYRGILRDFLNILAAWGVKIEN